MRGVHSDRSNWEGVRGLHPDMPADGARLTPQRNDQDHRSQADGNTEYEVVHLRATALRRSSVLAGGEEILSRVESGLDQQSGLAVSF